MSEGAVISKKIAPYAGKESFIFISYSHRDSEVVIKADQSGETNQGTVL